MKFEDMTPEQIAVAIENMKRCAENGDDHAAVMLGMCYETGTKCPKDPDQAVYYYRLAAMRNDAEAQFRLGRVLLYTDSLQNNPHFQEWLHWIVCAAYNGHQTAKEGVERYADTEEKRQMVSYLVEHIQKYGIEPELPEKHSGGCYIATCVYGSYDCPQVWTLRRFRDNTLTETLPGRVFIKVYYAVSPTVVKYFGKTGLFRKFWRGVLDRFVAGLNRSGVEDTPYRDRKF